MKNVALLSFFLCLIMACIKEGPVGPKGPDGPPYTFPPGNITGYIELHDQFGGLIGRGDSVFLRTYNADSIFSAYTDSTGFFKLRQLPPGNYDISITKPGFDSLHIFVQHAGGKLDKFTDITSINEHVTTKLLSITLDSIRNYPGQLILDVRITFKWPQPFITDKVAITAFLDTSSVPGAGRSLSNFFTWGVNTNIDNIKGTTSGYFRLNDSLVTSGTNLYVTAVVVPTYSVRRSWFNYATALQVPYPYWGDSLRTHITQLK